MVKRLSGNGSESRLLGIDYGTRRIGLSYGDALGVAVPLPPATAPSEEQRLIQVRKLVVVRGITDLVIGIPCCKNGSPSAMAGTVEEFIIKLKNLCDGLPVHRIDEYLTTHQARRDAEKHQRSSSKTFRGRRKERLSGLLDSRAATLILQDYLNHQVHCPNHSAPSTSPHTNA